MVSVCEEKILIEILQNFVQNKGPPKRNLGFKIRGQPEKNPGISQAAALPPPPPGRLTAAVGALPLPRSFTLPTFCLRVGLALALSLPHQDPTKSSAISNRNCRVLDAPLRAGSRCVTSSASQEL